MSLDTVRAIDDVWQVIALVDGVLAQTEMETQDSVFRLLHMARERLVQLGLDIDNASVSPDNGDKA